MPPPSIPRVLDDALASDAGHPALVTRTGTLTYAELDAAADRAAVAWWDLGVRPGDRVAASLPNDTPVVVAFHGAMRIGAIWLGINRALAPPEQRFQLDDTGASVLLSDTPPDDIEAIAVPTDDWGEMVRTADGDAPDVEIDPDAPAGIAYTSGTTGRPKGALHSQRGLLTPGAVLVESRGYDRTLRKGDCFPFTILNMAVLTTLLVSQAGGTSILMDRIDAEGVAEWIRDHDVNVWNGPPALLHSLAEFDTVAPDDLASLREVWTGGADCPEVIRSAFHEKFGHQVLATYGLSEAPTVVAIDPVGGPHSDGASGRPLPHLSVEIRDADGRVVAADEPGEVCVSPAPDDPRYSLMLGYWNRPDATAETLADDVLHTGDVGFLDDEGLLHIRDRLSLVIIRGGANVYPAEVERVLQAIDGVAASAVFGIPDDRLGERVVALVEPEPGVDFDVDAVIEHCRGELARYKVPERVTVVDGLPRNAMGKIVRAELADLL